MLTRRPFLALPFLALAGPAAAGAAPLSPRAAPRGWRHDVSEIRIAGVPASPIAARLGVAVTTASLAGEALVQALNKGHLEAAVLDQATLSRAVGLMGSRLSATPAGAGRAIAIRTALPGPLAADLLDALAPDPFGA